MVKRPNTSIAIACGDAKLSALFFDEVIPLTDSTRVPAQVKAPIDPYDITPPPIVEMLREADKLQVSSSEAVALVDNVWAFRIQRHLAGAGTSAVPFFENSTHFGLYLPKGHTDAIEFRLSRIGVIDGEALEWDQVLDIRSDKAASAKLRRLRLFLTDHYEDASDTYLRDSLLQKIGEYEEACGKHGLKLTISTISKLLDSKSLLGVLGITSVGILMGNPVVVGVTLLGGAAIEIGKVALHIAEKKLEFTSWKNSAEIAYLMEVKAIAANKADAGDA